MPTQPQKKLIAYINDIHKQLVQITFPIMKELFILIDITISCAEFWAEAIGKRRLNLVLLPPSRLRRIRSA
jgi:hypothetical protein